MPREHNWDIYADEEPTEIHHQDCEDTPEDSYVTGDAIAEVVHDPDAYARESETFDTSCECLDPVLGTDRHDPDVADLPSGTVVYFRVGTGTVWKGTLLEGSSVEHGYNRHADGSRVVRVEIDRDTHPTDDGLPDHLAPPSYQPVDDDGWVFRDAYTVDAEEQTYVVRDNLVEVVERPEDDAEATPDA